MAQAAIGGSSVENILSFEIQRRINKSLSNSVGLWHQHVLGLADGWEDLGSNGGGVDLRTVEGYRDARFGKPIFAEVKNRFNTIKASDEKNLWDTLDLTAKTNNAVSYVFQIVPKTVERYDREWRVSGRPEKGTVMARQLMKWCSTAKMLFMSYTRLSRAFLQMCLETIAPLIQIASKIFTMAVFRSEPVGIA